MDGCPHCVEFSPRWNDTFRPAGQQELGEGVPSKVVEVTEQPKMFERLELDETEKAKFEDMGYPTMYRAVRGDDGKTRIEFFEGHTPPPPPPDATEEDRRKHETAQADSVREWLRAPAAPAAAVAAVAATDTSAAAADADDPLTN